MNMNTQSLSNTFESHYERKIDGTKDKTLIFVNRWLKSLSVTYQYCREYINILILVNNELDEKFRIKNFETVKERLMDLLDYLTNNPQPVLYSVMPLYNAIKNKSFVYNVCCQTEQLRIDLYEYNRRFKVQIKESINTLCQLNIYQKEDYCKRVDGFDHDMLELMKNEINVNPFATKCLTL